MHASHGSDASVPSASIPSSDGGGGGGGGSANPSSSHPISKSTRFSRSNSISSASVITIKKAGSRSSSGTEFHTALTPMRPESPSGEPSLVALKLGRDRMSKDRERRKSVAVDPTERTTGDAGGSLHRWSQSTSSSATTVGGNGTRRSRANSVAVLSGVTEGACPNPGRRGSTASTHSPRASPQRRAPGSPLTHRKGPLAAVNSEREWRQQYGAAGDSRAPPPLYMTPALTDPNDIDSPSTIATVATPASQLSNGHHDYFGEALVSPHSQARARKPATSRNQAAPVIANPSSMGFQSAGAVQEAGDHRISEYREEGSRDAALRSKQTEKQQAAKKPSIDRDQHRHKASKSRDKGDRDKKAMLSKALQQANTAVLLDNAQNFERALEAYSDACRLLQLVMDKSSTVEDKRKLECIQVTYANRIEELHQLEWNQSSTSDEKSLPARPTSEDSMEAGPIESDLDSKSGRGSAVIETANLTTIGQLPRLSYSQKDRDSFFSGTMRAVEDSARNHGEQRKSLIKTEVMGEETHFPVQQSAMISAEYIPQSKEDGIVQSDDKVSSGGGSLPPQMTTLPSPGQNAFMPAPLLPRPLSPRRPQSPDASAGAERKPSQPSVAFQTTQDEQLVVHDDSGPSMSWLKTVDESDSDCAVHSRGSHQELRRKHIRNTSAPSNPDFDAAFDAAVEAAYDQGLEPDLDERRKRETVLRNGAPRQSVLGPLTSTKGGSSAAAPYHYPWTSTPTLDDEGHETDDEAEERLLDEITQDFANTFNFDLSTKSALPRQSDSSGYSRSTWQSSQVSDRTTANTSLSTVAEDAASPVAENPSPAPPKNNDAAMLASIGAVLADFPQQPTPPPQQSLPRPPSMSQNRLSGLRGKKLAAQSAPKPLTIETKEATGPSEPSAMPNPGTLSDDDERQVLPRQRSFDSIRPGPSDIRSDTHHENLLTSNSNLDMQSLTNDTLRPSTARTVTTERTSISRCESFDASPGEMKPYRPNPFRRKKSSLSLRELNNPVSSPEDPGTPGPTPLGTSFFSKRPYKDSTHRDHFVLLTSTPSDIDDAGGAHLFSTMLTDCPTSPTASPHSSSYHKLEPCPTPNLLRPFWLLRTLHKTLTCPSGAPLTTRLHLPPQAWTTRGVKIRALDAKIAACDLLTAALGRLAGVDTFDADALMNELQGFEEVMERVQANLAKKLGAEVGVHGATTSFKDTPHAPSASAVDLNTSVTGADASIGSVDGKPKAKESKTGGYFTSLRKLRNKSSAAASSGSASATASTSSGTRVASAPSSDSGAGAFNETMATVPMTSFVPVQKRGAGKKDEGCTSSAGGSGAAGARFRDDFEGPQKDYMATLVRLCESVHILDQIARQVEDPGLKGTSPTHVGLELSIRHAAEFFAFYVCRFVLADVALLMERFLRRGTEWVLA